MSPRDDPGHRRHDGRVTLAGPGRCQSGRRRIQFGLGLVDGSLADKFLCLELLLALEIHFGIGMDRPRRPHRLACFAGIDAHQDIAFLDDLPGIDPDLQHAPRKLRPDGSLLNRLDDGISGKSQIDGMRANCHQGQWLRREHGNTDQGQTEHQRAKGICIHEY